MSSSISSLPSQGYFLTLEAEPSPDQPDHHLGGELANAPACRNCETPFVQLMSLDTRDVRLGLDESDAAKLSLIFCWRCVSGEGRLSYSLRGGRPEVRSQTTSTPRFNFPYADYPESFPRVSFRLHPIPDQVTQARELQLEGRLAEGGDWVRKFDFEVPLHQVGGVPCVERSITHPVCPDCGEAMPFLALVADDPHLGKPFTGIERARVLFFHCRACRLISATGWLPDDDGAD